MGQTSLSVDSPLSAGQALGWQEKELASDCKSQHCPEWMLLKESCCGLFNGSFPGGIKALSVSTQAGAEKCLSHELA